jgi:hypothetical protein
MRDRDGDTIIWLVGYLYLPIEDQIKVICRLALFDDCGTGRACKVFEQRLKEFDIILVHITKSGYVL